MIRRCVLALLVIALGPAIQVQAAKAQDVEPPASVIGSTSIPIASDARVVGDEAKTRFILDLTEKVEISAFTLADPYRVIVDLPEVEFQLSPDAGLTGRGLVTGWRYGLFARGRSRIVLDAGDPIAIEAAFVLPAAEGAPARLVVDLARTTAEEFRADLLKSAAARAASNEVPLIKSDRLPPADLNRDRPLIMLDPGHGGIDAGTKTTDGVVEKDVVLAFALDLKMRLEASGKVDVRMTRDDDSFVPLGERVRIAREQGANLLVSIHADSVKQDFVRGATVYTLSERASDQAAAALAIKENAADAVAGLDDEAERDEVTDILVELTRRETKVFALAFADGLVHEISSTTRMIRNPKRAASFQVLRAPDVPSVLVEIGYLSNADDAKLIASEDWRVRMSIAITQAILRFFGPQVATSAG